MEALGVAIVVASGYVLAFWSQRGKAAAESKRDHAQWNAKGLADERDTSSRKLAAASATIIRWTHWLQELALAGRLDPRELAAAVAQHEHGMHEAGLPDPGHGDNVHPAEGAKPGVPNDASGKVSEGGRRDTPGLLDPFGGDGGGDVHDPREVAARRDLPVRGGE